MHHVMHATHIDAVCGSCNAAARVSLRNDIASCLPFSLVKLVAICFTAVLLLDPPAAFRLVTNAK